MRFKKKTSSRGKRARATKQIGHKSNFRKRYADGKGMQPNRTDRPEIPPVKRKAE